MAQVGSAGSDGLNGSDYWLDGSDLLALLDGAQFMAEPFTEQQKQSLMQLKGVGNVGRCYGSRLPARVIR